MEEYDEIRKEKIKEMNLNGDTGYKCNLCKKPVYCGEQYYIEEKSLSKLIGGKEGFNEEKEWSWGTLLLCMDCYKATGDINTHVRHHTRDGMSDEDDLE